MLGTKCSQVPDEAIVEQPASVNRLGHRGGVKGRLMNLGTSALTYLLMSDLKTGGNATDSMSGANGIWDGDVDDNIAVEGIIGTASQSNDTDGGNGEEHYRIANLSGLNGAKGGTFSPWFKHFFGNSSNNGWNGILMTRFLEATGGSVPIWGLPLRKIELFGELAARPQSLLVAKMNGIMR